MYADGDKDARQQLDKLNAEDATLAAELKSLDGARLGSFRPIPRPWERNMGWWCRSDWTGNSKAGWYLNQHQGQGWRGWYSAYWYARYLWSVDSRAIIRYRAVATVFCKNDQSCRARPLPRIGERSSPVTRFSWRHDGSFYSMADLKRLDIPIPSSETRRKILSEIEKINLLRQKVHELEADVSAREKNIKSVFRGH
jgi:hypothetical protein